jgi:hypothetical protein
LSSELKIPLPGQSLSSKSIPVPEIMIYARVGAQRIPVLTFCDVGALVYHLRLVASQIPDFDPERYEMPLLRLHQRIGAEGHLDVQL